MFVPVLGWAWLGLAGLGGAGCLGVLHAGVGIAATLSAPFTHPPTPLAHRQVHPKEFRRALDEAAKLKAAQAAQDELLAGANGADAFEELKKLAVEGARGYLRFFCCALFA